MRSVFSPILIFSACCLLAGSLRAETIPEPNDTRFPKIKASLDDGFFSLAEQQACGVLRSAPNAGERRTATLLLAHAFWGQKRYSELLALVRDCGDDPGLIYWKARALFELRQYEKAGALLKAKEASAKGSSYEPGWLRLRGRIALAAGDPKEAGAAFESFEQRFSSHPEAVENRFDWATALIRQGRREEAARLYETLAKTPGRTAWRADLQRAGLLCEASESNDCERAWGLLTNLATNETADLLYRIDAYVDLAKLDERLGNVDKAAEALRLAADLSPDARQRVPLKLSLVRLLHRSGKTAEALKLLEACRAEVPNERLAMELQLEKAKLLLREKRHAEAAEAYQVYLEVADDPKGLASAYLGRGLALWEMGRYAESAAAFDKAEKGPCPPSDRANALFKAGDAYYRIGKFPEAVERYGRFAKEFPVDENRPKALYQMGLALAESGNSAEAMKIFERVERRYPGTPIAEKAAVRYADMLQAAADWEGALKKYREIGSTYAKDAAALGLHQSGLMLYRLGRYEEALAAFDRVLAKYPKVRYAAQAVYMRGFCLYLLGRTEEAEKTCLSYVEKYPRSEWTPEVLFWLAEQYYNQGRYKDAKKLFLRIPSEFEESSLAPRALYRAGRAAAADSDFSEAVALYGRVAKTYPDTSIMPQVRFAQGDALSQLGDFSRAILAFEEIIKNHPESSLVDAAWGRKGDCQFALAANDSARYAEAINSYGMPLGHPTAALPLKWQAEYKLGRCLEKTGKPEKAFAHYANVVYSFLESSEPRTTDAVTWFTRAAFGAAAIKEEAKDWTAAARLYARVVESGVPAKAEALRRMERIKKDNWLLFRQAEETNHVESDR